LDWGGDRFEEGMPPRWWVKPNSPPV